MLPGHGRFLIRRGRHEDQVEDHRLSALLHRPDPGDGGRGLSAIGRADRYIERVSHAHRQLETITALSLHANRYSEQIAEMLLFGEPGRVEFEEARRDLTASFVALEEVTMREIDFLDDPAEGESERRGAGRCSTRCGPSPRSMHATALELLEVKLSGREDEARLRYFGEIEEDLDDRLQRLIDLAIADEQAEVGGWMSETRR